MLRVSDRAPMVAKEADASSMASMRSACRLPAISRAKLRRSTRSLVGRVQAARCTRHRKSE